MSDTGTSLKLFGPKWDGTPAGDVCERVDTPVGATCASCDTEITASQSGVFMWHITDTGAEYRPLHRICFLIPTLGPLVRGVAMCPDDDCACCALARPGGGERCTCGQESP